MRKYMRYLPAALVVSSAVCALVAVVCCLIGIWVPDWQRAADQGNMQVWYYDGDDRWFHTALLFGFMAAGFGAARAWEGQHN